MLKRYLLGATCLFFCMFSNGVICGAKGAVISTPSLSQNVIGSWQIQDGLPHNTIYSIKQTRDGYIWIGTEDGLVRFDGQRFQVFNTANTPALKVNAIRALFAASDGSLWIGTQWGGLTHFKDGAFQTFTTENGLSNNFVRSIYESSDGRLWIGTYGGGLNEYHQGNFKSYTTKDGLSSNVIRDIYEDRKGRLWISTAWGLSILEHGKLTGYVSKDGFPNVGTIAVREDWQRNLWIATDGAGLIRLEEKEGILSFNHVVATTAKIMCILPQRNGEIWLGTYGVGLMRVNNEKIAPLEITPGLTGNKIQAMFEDTEGSVWLGLESDGLAMVRKSQFLHLGTKEGFFEGAAWSITETKDASLWIGTSGGGAYEMKDGRFLAYSKESGLPSNLIFTVHEGSDDSLWFGTVGGGLAKYKYGRFQTFRAKEGVTENIRAIEDDGSGGIWFGTAAYGLGLLKDGHCSFQTTNDGLPSNWITALHKSLNGDLWVGSIGGLSVLQNGRIKTYTVKDGLVSNRVGGIYEDQQGTLWITTMAGLSRLKGGKFTSYTRAQGLYTDHLIQVFEDGIGRFWFVGSNGVFLVSAQQLDEVAEGKRTAVDSIYLDKADGLYSNECSAGLLARDGKVWLATSKGLFNADPQTLDINRIAPPVIIESLLVDGREVSSEVMAAIPPNQGELEFRYTGLSYVAPARVKFKYMLEGWDKGWVEAGTRRTAYYTNLPPGEYRFRVIACNNDGVWNDRGALLEFHLKPRFYQTKGFYALCILSVVVLGFGLYRFRGRQLQRRTRVLEAIIDERTGELKREQEKVVKLEKVATEQQMAGGFAHEMRNALAGSKLILDQALALDGPEPHVSLNLANCRNLKEMYLGLKEKLSEHDTQIVLAQMQGIFANEERLEEVMQLVRKATNRGLNITQQIMDYSKMGQQQAGQQRVELQHLIESIVDESREEFRTQGVVVEYKSEPAGFALVGDESHFYSIFQNIILNARDALIDASVKDRNDRRIEISSALEDGTCTVVIADKGIGIPQESLEQVFELFFSTKPATGTGLGLGMVKKMLAIYNGSIDISSQVGQGTSVTVCLPQNSLTKK